MIIVRLFLLFLTVASGSNTYAQQKYDSCPNGFDRLTAKDGGLYLMADMSKPLNTPKALAPKDAEALSIKRSDARSYFYFMRRGTQLPSGAISVRRVYKVVNSSTPKDVIMLTNNQRWDGVEHKRGLEEYIAYHQRPLGNDSRFRQRFHFEYFNTKERTDSRQDKVKAIQVDRSDFNASNINKIMLLRYLGVRQDGTCIKFELFSDDADGLLSATREFLIEIQELEGAGGKAVPRVLLNIGIL